MGSPEFAIPSLELISRYHDVVEVYTMPPKPAKRGLNIQKSPIHVFAESLDIAVKTPSSLKNHKIKDIDCIVVVAYGLILPKHILEKPTYGCINVHPSLLPRWRGAAPIHRAIMSGDTESGVCTMNMSPRLDDGDLLLVEKTKINDKDNIITLSDRLSKIGADLLLRTLDNIDNIIPTPQSLFGISYANKVKKVCIDWNEDANSINNKIKALMGLYCPIFNVKIIQSSVDVQENNKAKPGQILNDDFYIKCGKYTLIPEIVQIPGRKQITVQDFLKSNNLDSIKRNL